MTNYSPFSDKAIRSKSKDQMNSAEAALFQMQVEQAVEAIKSKYRGEGQTLIEIAQALRDEGGRLLYGNQPSKEQEKRQEPQPARDGLKSLFDPD